MAPLQAWFFAFLLTCAIEIPIVVALTRESDIGWQRRALLACYGQLMTHPFVWYVLPSATALSPLLSFTVSEMWAWLGEAALYATVGMPRRPLGALAAAAIANGVSLGAGFLLHF